MSRSFATDIQASGAARVVAVGSRHQESADHFAAAHGIEAAHGSYEALVSDPSVDVVFVGTPHPMHHANGLLALHAGKPVVITKPFTMNAAEARDLVEVARAADLFVMEAMWTRFLPIAAELRRLLRDGALGEVVTVLANNGLRFAPDPKHRLFAPELGGGAMLDLGVYPLSFASMVLGKPDRIASLTTPTFTGVDGQTSILLGYPSGAQAIITCTLAATMRSTVTIAGTEGRIEMDHPLYAPGGFTLVPAEGDPVRYDPTHTGRGHHYEATEVARCLDEGLLESPLMPLDETVWIMETVDAALTGTGVDQ